MILLKICENLASIQYLRKYEYIHIMSYVYMLLHMLKPQRVAS